MAMHRGESRARAEVLGIPGPRLDTGTLLLLLYSSGQSKYKSSPKSTGGETGFTSLLNCKITRQRSEVEEEMKNVLGH